MAKSKLLYDTPASKSDVESAAKLLRYEAKKMNKKRTVRIVKFGTGWNLRIS